MTTTTVALVAFAVSFDLLVGEPRTRWHPVAWFGTIVGLVDRDWDLDTGNERWLGLVVALVFPAAAAGLVGGLVGLAGFVHPTVAALLAGVVLFLTTSLRSLLELTEAVVEESKSDPETARQTVRGLAGRDASSLSPAQLRSAAIESAAENLADGFVATLAPFVLLAPVSLPAAAAAATWVKAVNTLDSMLGYPDKPIGTASARLDDVVMWLPARLTAGSLALAAGRPRALATARQWVRTPPSPNSGWPMAVAAVVLSVRLEKPDVYALNPAGREPTGTDGDRAVRLVGVGAIVALLVLVVATIALDAGVVGATGVPGVADVAAITDQQHSLTPEGPP
ncbi:cobalamin biosynthesis protein CobD [Halovivax asiaticus JCM 14624]|uniref:Probable cobalamin biosynthesis protein CobD n=1 Tax=Halovivax asiaticus JCM 14624 TaxID=1227490 RepID=M0BEW9_9EURY|nr:adenosylcobinamide-phosphate synthase CbiB [Halovivax asiaticus]ELZ08194.1 cobalamin biosynthesis protein CobD [Halovivax asiaticus JCM 14624]